jgi:hypothetical protein
MARIYNKIKKKMIVWKKKKNKPPSNPLKDEWMMNHATNRLKIATVNLETLVFMDEVHFSSAARATNNRVENFIIRQLMKLRIK